MKSDTRKTIVIVIVAALLTFCSLAVVSAQEATTQTAVEAAKEVISPEIKSELHQWLVTLRSAVETGAAFATEQIPLVLWEKIVMDRVYYTLLSLFALFITISFPIMLMRRYIADVGNWPDYARTKEDTIAAAKAITSLVFMIIHGLGFIFLTLAFLDVLFYKTIMVWFAPRVYLLEWIKSLL